MRPLRHAPTLAHCAFGLLLCASLAAPQPALAKKHGGAHPPGHSAAHAKGARKGNRAAAPRSSSEESRAERERRLQRECRGLPNAGACLGYAS
ncbi:MAG: hypothetical protein LWW82_11640 [Comamonadaceae bacterium]|nr:hypothetical protein [Comamonadaceae bacterium]